jgi:hypothetical protein
VPVFSSPPARPQIAEAESLSASWQSKSYSLHLKSRRDVVPAE